jgi:hypothetical protein
MQDNTNDTKEPRTRGKGKIYKLLENYGDINLEGPLNINGYLWGYYNRKPGKKGLRLNCRCKERSRTECNCELYILKSQKIEIYVEDSIHNHPPNSAEECRRRSS